MQKQIGLHTSSTPPTHTHTNVILIVSTSSHLGLGCEVPSSRSREEAFASFCSPLVLEVVGLVLLKKYRRYKPKYEQEKHNEDFGNSSITTRNGTSWFILLSCSLLLVFSFSASFLPPSSSLYFHFEDFSLPGICTSQWLGTKWI